MSNHPSAGAPRTDQRAAVTWDTSLMTSWYSDLASAMNTPDGIALSFGARREQSRSQAIRAELLRRIVIDRAAAQGLVELLSTLIAEYDARYHSTP